MTLLRTIWKHAEVAIGTRPDPASDKSFLYSTSSPAEPWATTTGGIVLIKPGTLSLTPMGDRYRWVGRRSGPEAVGVAIVWRLE